MRQRNEKQERLADGRCSRVVRKARILVRSKELLLVARSAAALGFLVVLGSGGCDSTEDCCGSCQEGNAAAFQLSCSSYDLKSVVATGPCAMPDASVSSYMGNGTVLVQSDGPGACHVELTFATGFTYSADVTFASHSGGVCGGPQCACPDYVTPTSGPFMVNNPSSTCVDASVDAPSEAAPCPSGASQSVPCDYSGSCMGCRENAGFECACSDADGSGPVWQCIDTGYSCAGTL
jgi:hypothetical protein